MHESQPKKPLVEFEGTWDDTVTFKYVNKVRHRPPHSNLLSSVHLFLSFFFCQFFCDFFSLCPEFFFFFCTQNNEKAAWKRKNVQPNSVAIPENVKEDERLSEKYV